MSLPVWGEWIEICNQLIKIGFKESLPVWGEWIEIGKGLTQSQMEDVSPRVGRVD